jgi:hypothetical protein
MAGERPNGSYPVRPHITDPEIGRDVGFVPMLHDGASVRNPSAMAQTPPSFFQSHKFALIVSAIVLCVFLVIMVVHVTKKGGKKKKKIEISAQAEAAELEEMKKLQAMRKMREAGKPPQAERDRAQSDKAQSEASKPRRPGPQPAPARAEDAGRGKKIPPQPQGAGRPSVGAIAASADAPKRETTKPVALSPEPLEEGLEGLLESLRDEESSRQPESEAVPPATSSQESE